MYVCMYIYYKIVLTVHRKKASYSTVTRGDFERFFNILLFKNFNIANAVIVKF